MKKTEFRSDSRFWAISAISFIGSVIILSYFGWRSIEYFGVSGCDADLSLDKWEICKNIFSQKSTIATLFLAIVALIVSSISTIALIITIAYTAKAANAAAEASDASKLSVELTRISIRQELRPYFTISQINNNHQKDSDGNIVARSLGLVWENVGSTPALNVHARCNLMVFDGNFPENFEYPDVKEHRSDVGVVGTGKTFQCGSRLLSLDEVRDVMAGTKKLRFWGWVEYDGFEPNQRYRTEHNVEVTWYYANDADDPNLLLWYTYMDEFNGLDDNCMRQPTIKSMKSFN